MTSLSRISIVVSGLILLLSNPVLAQDAKCDTVKDCANEMVALVGELQKQNSQLSTEIAELKKQLSTLQSNVSENSANHNSRITSLESNSVKYNEKIRLFGDDNLYLFSYNERNRDELDVILSGTGDKNAQWQVLRP